MKILITGSSGFVGTNFLKDVRTKNYEILSPPSSELDLMNKKSVEAYLNKFFPDLIINAAGRVGGIVENINNQYDFLLTNTTLNINLISSAVDAGIKNLINLSSSCIYPRDIDRPIKETDLFSSPLETTNEGYALAKIIGLKLTEYIANEKQLNYKTIIPCNLYGPYDNFDEKSGHMIASVIRRIHNAKVNKIKKIEIWGDGSARREFMYVSDLIDFIFFAIKNITKLPKVLNLGTGIDYSIKEYYDLISKTISFDGTYEYNLSKPIGMNKKLVDTSLINELDWRHKYGVEEGIKETYKFYIENYE